MLNAIWLSIMVLAVITGVALGRVDEVVKAITSSATSAIELAIGLIGVLSLWLGIMEIATQSGLVKFFARILSPIMKPLFPEVPATHPAMGAIILNIAANMLGLGSAATPFGLTAMKELQVLNAEMDQASNSMCTFLAINTSSVQLIPATAIAFLAANGNSHPTEIIFTGLVATIISTLVAIIAVKQLAKLPIYRMKEKALDSKNWCQS